jgi:streptomycin 6-kinase
VGRPTSAKPIVRNRAVVDVPPVVRNKALAMGAADWLDALPERVAQLADRWDLTLGPVFSAGTEALVIDAGDAVLKIGLPTQERASELTVLRLADGDGCVKLLAADEASGALLLERLGRSLNDLGLPVRERHAILVETARRVWRPAPDAALPTGAEKARQLARCIPEAYEAAGRPCSPRAVEHALACAAAREAAHDDARAVLVHGDVHEWNVLEAGTGWKLVDPDGLLAEPEYDLGVILREDPTDGDLGARADWLARETGLDRTAIWEWGVVERVSTGLLATRIALQPVGAEMLAAADALAELWNL